MSFTTPLPISFSSRMWALNLGVSRFYLELEIAFSQRPSMDFALFSTCFRCGIIGVFMNVHFVSVMFPLSDNKRLHESKLNVLIFG